ncbi:TetR/AcrR family transcriptional regulator [Mycobacterium bourgelatii]|nr:TetR/AcrR family transcriptional regulator [Mycobacterium bourgelatii]
MGGKSRPRKRPVQDRSRDTVRRILAATAELLQKRGYDGASTNRIASTAGISPGSLYQYFPNKEAIMDTLVEEYTQELLERVTSNLRAVTHTDPDNLVAAAVAAQLDAMLERPEILKVIAGQLPGRSGVELLKPIEALIGGAIREHLVAHCDPRLDFDVEAASWLMVQLLGATVRYVVDEPPITKEVFVAEMTRLVLSHPISSTCVMSNHQVAV